MVNTNRFGIQILKFLLLTLMLVGLSGCVGVSSAVDRSISFLETKRALSSQREEPAPVTMRTATITTVDEYAANPGMGWQYAGGEYPITYPAETVAYGPRAEISWKILNPAEGIYDWSILDQNLETVISQGKQFSFRVYTMQGESYGGHQLPQWVLNKGAVINPDGEVDFSNCVYQQEWGNFVNQLIERYDGNPDIAFIDISGYGNFNEWSWINQTDWDYLWASAYKNQTADRDTMNKLDSYARRILADMFISGSYDTHQCTTADGQVETVSYSYDGFEDTQLVMPYAGTIQSSQYVHSQDPTVGFRHDCLGRESSINIVADDRLGPELNEIWPVAPVIFETCSPNQFSMPNAEYLLLESHASLVHDVNVYLETEDILTLLGLIGYRYQLINLEYTDQIQPGEVFTAVMEWQNQGNAPSYPRMGQTFELHIYLVDDQGKVFLDILAPADISEWMPAPSLGETPPTYTVVVEELIPGNIQTPLGYHIEVQIIETRTGEPIWLPFEISE